jgi:endoglucanase
MKNYFPKNQCVFINLRCLSVFFTFFYLTTVVGNTYPKKENVKKMPPLRTINCSTLTEILTAMANAQAGDEIIIQPGTYESVMKIKDIYAKFNYFSCGANGTAANPIILRGASSTNIPVLRVAESLKFLGPTLGITGDYWIIKDLEFSNGQKGIMMDGAYNCQLINVTVHTTGEEAIHLRHGSSNNLIQNCKIYNAGIQDPGNGEGIYVGSDQKVHFNPTAVPNSTYDPNVLNNTIEGCTFGVDIRAEAIDVKEGSQNTIIRNCSFLATGISGMNSADSFIDLKGGYVYVYGNTFDVGTSTIIASAVDFQQRDAGTNTGYRQAIFNNTLLLGSRSFIPTARRQGGKPSEIHVWNNTRTPASADFPTADPQTPVTLKYVIQTCPAWNILPCGTVVTPTNAVPTVSITSPANGTSNTAGASITITATAADSDGTISKVSFYRGTTLLGEDTSSPYQYTITSATAGNYAITAKATDNSSASTTSSVVNITVSTTVVTPTNVAPTVSITSPTNGTTYTSGASIAITATATDSDGTISKVGFYNGTTLLGEDNTSPYQYTITSASAGSYSITAKATDNSSASSTSAVVNLTVSAPTTGGTVCNFGTPTANALDSFDRITFTKMYVLGSGGPSNTNFKSLKINWILATKTLNQFGYNTVNGVPAYYVELKATAVQNFGASNPAINIIDSGYPGLDGEYWVTKKGLNLILVSKTKGYTLYFTNETTAPSCSASRINSQDVNAEMITVNPNPASDLVNLSGLTSDTIVTVIDMQGKTIISKKLNTNENKMDVSTLKTGIYILNAQYGDYVQNIRLNITR